MSNINPLFLPNIQHVLPAVYDDSLSYYEVLCKMLHKLNETISNLNVLQDAVAQLPDFTEFNQMRDDIASALTDISSINDDINNLQTTMATKADKSELTAINARIDDVLMTIDTINDTLSRLERDMLTQGDLTSINNELANLRNTTSTLQNDIASIREDMLTSEDLEPIEEWLATLTERINRLLRTVSTIQADMLTQDDLTPINSAVSDLNTDVTNLTSTVSQIQGDMLTSEDLAPINTSISNLQTLVNHINETYATKQQLSVAQQAINQINSDLATIRNNITALGTTVSGHTDAISDIQDDITRIDAIIAGLGGGGVRSWPTVAGMKADTFTEYPVVGHTEGFYASGDGGGAWYVVNDTGTANGADVIACGDNTSIAHYVHVGGAITPEMLGAKGDGVTNDWLAVTRAIEIYPFNVVLSSTYYIYGTPSYMSGFGNGMLYVSGVLRISGGGTLKYPNNGVFTYDETHETYGMSMFLFNECDVVIENITFDMNGSNNIIDSISNRNGEALLGSVSKCSIANVTFKNCAAAHTVMLSGGKAYYSNCTFVDCGTYLQNNTQLTSSDMLSVQHDSCFINGCIFTNSVKPSNPKISYGIVTYSGDTTINECMFTLTTEAIYLNSQARQLNNISVTNCIMNEVHNGIIYQQHNNLSYISLKNNVIRCVSHLQSISVAIGCPNYNDTSSFNAMQIQIEGNYIYNERVGAYGRIGIAVMGFTSYLNTIVSNKIYASAPIALGPSVNHININDNWLESQYNVPLIHRLSSTSSPLAVIASDIIISNNTAKGGKLIADISSITNLTLNANYADIEQSILNNLPQGFNISLDGMNYNETTNAAISNTIHGNIGEYTYRNVLIHSSQSTVDITIPVDYIATLLSANITLNNGLVGTLVSYTTSGYLNVKFRVSNVTSDSEYLVNIRYKLGR